MFEKLLAMQERFAAIAEKLSDPAVISDRAQYAALMKEHKNLTPIMETFAHYRTAQAEAEEAHGILDAESDPELCEMAQAQLDDAKERLAELEETLKLQLLPKDPNDDKSVIIEIRSGVGGEEAALFAGSIFRMYSMYAETHHWNMEIMNASPTELGGYKEISFSVEGEGAYSRLKYESGVHRVQRVPETESQGRIQTSAVTVAVLPEADEVELAFAPPDLKIDYFRSSGAGGQHVNKTESAVRITHLPTGITVECQDERSQHKNKDKAMKVLRARVYETLQREQNDKIASERKSQVGSGDRSERIRTYNFPQGRLTDHRINLTLYRLEAVMNGDLDEIIDSLATADQAAKLAGGDQ